MLSPTRKFADVCRAELLRTSFDYSPCAKGRTVHLVFTTFFFPRGNRIQITFPVAGSTEGKGHARRTPPQLRPAPSNSTDLDCEFDLQNANTGIAAGGEIKGAVIWIGPAGN